MPNDQLHLGDRLRSLREQHPLSPAQTQVAEALGVARQLVSAWEKGVKPVPEERVEALARLFAADAAGQSALHLKKETDFSPRESGRFKELFAELSALPRLQQTRSSPDEAPRPGWFWRFDDGLPITIIGSKQPGYVVRDVPEASRYHPDYIETLHHADADAEIELYGQIRAMNPDVEVRRIVADQVKNPLVTGHVVVIGGGLVNHWAEWFAGEMSIPVALAEDGGETLDSSEWRSRRFAVLRTDRTDRMSRQPYAETELGADGQEWTVYRPEFRGEVVVPDRRGGTEPGAGLFKDVALIARMQNTMKSGATVTLFVGLFSRGTYGAVRAFTDPNFLDDNENYLAARIGARPVGQRFWSLNRVLCDRTVSLTGTVDLSNDENRLLESYE
jgi:transcriptional regulator with XRE-family HTH domain